MSELMLGLMNVLSFQNILAMAFGMILGLFIGSMPGLSTTMGLALLLPVTYGMDPATGITMLASLFVGSHYGGSISAILIKTPGTPSAAATALDGYPMAERGEAGKALGISLTSSIIGGIMSGIALLTIAPLLGTIALAIGPVEMFAIVVLGMTIIGSLSTGSVIKGTLSGTIGLLLALVGMDPITGVPRFTFGNLNLFDGIPFVVGLIGLFSIPQALKLIETDMELRKAGKIRDRMLPTWEEFKKFRLTTIRSGIIGIIVGLIPGTGGETASWFSYNEAKRFSKEKEKFGTGHPEGIAAPEAANSAVVGGALIPTITLGVPGSTSAAVLLGGLMVHGIMPGPTLMTDYAEVTYTLMWAVLISVFFLFAFGFIYTKLSVSVTKIPSKVLAPIIVLLGVIGSYAINNSMFDVMIMFTFGIIGYFMDKINMPVPPLVIGLILGTMLDVNLHQALIIGGSWLVFVTNPISFILLIIALLSLLQATPFFGWIKRGFFKNANGNKN